MVRHHKAILIFTVVSALSLMCFGSALAMPEYAKRFKLSCTFCHTKFPALNEFGASFLKDNPTPPDMKASHKVGGNMSSQGNQEPSGNKDDVKSVKAPGDSFYDNTTSSKSTLLVEPPAPTIVYRRVGKDGNLIFTDNPSGTTLQQGRQKSGGGTIKSTATKKNNRPTKQTKVQPLVSAKRPDISGNALQQERQESGGDTIKSIATRKNKRPAKQAKAQPPIGVEHTDIDAKSDNSAERYRSYEDCMEKILLASKQPATADEIMVVFVEAEKACRQYSRVQ